MGTEPGPERWKKIDEIFAGAADLPPGERTAFVTRACGDDASLRAEVMALLAEEPDAKGALQRIVGAATPHLEPAAPTKRSLSLAINVAILAITAITVLALVAFARHRFTPSDAPLSTWSLNVDGTTNAVTLPNNLFAQFRFRNVAYTLERDLLVRADQRGQKLTLHVDCFHAPLALVVDGVPVDDIGDSGVGEHRYVIAASHQERVHLSLHATHDLVSGYGFGVAPYVSIGVAPRAPTATFDRWVATIAQVMAGLFTLLFGMMYLLDRRRREYLAWVISTLASSVMTLHSVGVLPNAFLPARYSFLALTTCVAAVMLSVEYVLRQVLGMRASRVWPVLFAMTVVCAAAQAVSQAASIAQVISTIVYPAFFIHVVVQCVVRGRGDNRVEARILLVWAVAVFVISAFETMWRATGTNMLAGLHGPMVNVLLLAVAQIAVIATQDTHRRRTLETTAEELRRQIAQRSKDLADTLAKLSRDHDAPFVAGRTLDGRYRIVRTLGAGGMGTVYEAERLTDSKRVALKTVLGRFDAKQMARLAREGQLAADIAHPNVVSVIDIGVAEGVLYLVMDLVDGGGLDQQRARFGDVKWATPLVAQIARGLAALHARGIVHRDLKPSNILVFEGVARISDFGISMLHEDRPVDVLDATAPQPPQLTRHGDVFGTPMYMAPELAAGAERAAPSSDIFSFGVLAHELLAGRSPFAEPPVVARLRGHDIPQPSLDVTGEIRTVISRCIEIDPKKRPTAADLVVDLASR